jgi:hypothetical protein
MLFEGTRKRVWTLVVLAVLMAVTIVGFMHAPLWSEV